MLSRELRGFPTICYQLTAMTKEQWNQHNVLSRKFIVVFPNKIVQDTLYYCFEFIPWDSLLVRSAEKTFSASAWGAAPIQHREKFWALLICSENFDLEIWKRLGDSTSWTWLIKFAGSYPLQPTDKCEARCRLPGPGLNRPFYTGIIYFL